MKSREESTKESREKFLTAFQKKSEGMLDRILQIYGVNPGEIHERNPEEFLKKIL